MFWVRSSIASCLDRDRSDFARAIECGKSVAHVVWTDKKTAKNQQIRRSPRFQASLLTYAAIFERSESSSIACWRLASG
jgi:hypothetical protein